MKKITDFGKKEKQQQNGAFFKKAPFQHLIRNFGTDDHTMTSLKL